MKGCNTKNYYQSLEEDKNSTADNTVRPLTQSECPVKVLWHVPTFHIFIVLSAEPVKIECCLLKDKVASFKGATCMSHKMM